jgi:hypothetical protein
MARTPQWSTGASTAASRSGHIVYPISAMVAQVTDLRTKAGEETGGIPGRGGMMSNPLYRSSIALLSTDTHPCDCRMSRTREGQLLSQSLPSQAPGTISREVGEEYVVLTLASGQAHALTGDVAVVWRAAVEGVWPDLAPELVDGIAAELVDRGLFEGSGLDRRTILRNGARVIAAAGITSIALPPASAAASPAPTSNISPVSGPLGQAVAVVGSGFPSNSFITLSYDGVGQTLSGPINSDANGSIPSGVSFVVPFSTVGAHSVIVTVGGRSAVQHTYAVVAPNLSLSPNQGPLVGGTLVTTSGTGFQASTTALTATFNGTAVPLLGVRTPATDGVGATSGAPTFIVPALPGAGPHPVTVTDAAGNVGTATFTVRTGL